MLYNYLITTISKNFSSTQTLCTHYALIFNLYSHEPPITRNLLAVYEFAYSGHFI